MGPEHVRATIRCCKVSVPRSFFVRLFFCRAETHSLFWQGRGEADQTTFSSTTHFQKKQRPNARERCCFSILLPSSGKFALPQVAAWSELKFSVPKVPFLRILRLGLHPQGWSLSSPAALVSGWKPNSTQKAEQVEGRLAEVPELFVFTCSWNTLPDSRK